MSQPISFGPFQEFDLSDRFWPQPNCLLHFLSVEFLPKSRSSRLRQIYEWTARRHEMFQFRKHLSPGGRDKPVPSSCDIHQVVAVIVADDQRVKAMWPREIAADNKLLSAIHAILDPGAATFSR